MGKTQQLSDVMRQRLLFEIREGEFAKKDSLPPEIDLAEKLGVSRNIVRECLTRLEREGWVTRKHGVGTLINRNVAHVKTRLDLNFELSQTLELTGKKSETAFVRYQELAADREIARNLNLPERAPVVRVARLLKGDGKPLIYCVDYFAKSLIPNGVEYECDEMRKSIFSFLNGYCGVEVVTNLTEIRAMPVTQEVADALEVPLTCSLLFLGEIGYDLRSNIMLYSEEYYIDRAIQHMIVRKKI